MHIQWWIAFPREWKLQDVQAGLVVCVSLLAFIAVFTSARCFWHTSAKKISRNADVPISSLLSFTTLGEAFDVVILLKAKLLHSKYFALTFQCFLVIGFSACAIFAGPISRYATRTGLQDGLKLNKGLLASRSYGCDLSNVVRWHNVSQSLDKALFPYDQMLDFLPDTSTDWVYHADDWNSTFTAKCSITTEANITLQALGQYTGNEPTNAWVNIPTLKSVLSARYTNNVSRTYYDFYLSGTEWESKKIWTDINFYSYAEFTPNKNQKSIHLSTVAMLDVPRYQLPSNSSKDYFIGKGIIPNAWYTKVECDLTRNSDAVNYWAANVDNYLYECPVAKNMDAFFSEQSKLPQADESTQIKIPTGNEMWRFFQAFTVVKDTHFPRPANRLINQRLPVVEISTLFLVVMSLVALIVILGLIYCLVCRILYSDLYKRIPETKVDWLLQSLREAQGSGIGGGHSQSLAPSTIGDDEKFVTNEKQRIPWEKARYSLAQPHQSPALSSGYSTPASPSIGLGKVSIDRANGQTSPAPPSLVPGQTSPYTTPFSTFVNRNNGYSPLATPQPYTGASPVPSFTSPPMSPPTPSERFVSYGMNTARAQPVVNITPRTEKGEWEVGVVETRR